MAEPKPSVDLEKLAAALGGVVGPAPTSRYADWDAAIERRAPIKFKFLGTTWKVTPIDFRDLAQMFTVEAYIGLDDSQASAKQLAFIGDHVTDPAMWKKKTDAAKIAPGVVMGALTWLLKADAGMPLVIESSDDPDPLDAPPASSRSAGGNGRSSPGGSRKPASKTR